MSLDKKYPSHLDDDNQDTEGESGQGTGTSGGQSGHIEYKDFLGTNVPLRDDLLSPQQKNQYIDAHKRLNERLIKDQKALRDRRQAVKDGKITLENYRQGLTSGQEMGYKVHFLSATAQFGSGRDRQVNEIPTEQIAETNNEKREELQLGYKFNNQPKYTQAPRHSPPKLKPM